MLWNMVTHPDVQHKIQAELDEVLGQNRLPTPTQSQQLEYLQAVWRESMRLDPPAPLGPQLPYDVFDLLTLLYSFTSCDDTGGFVEGILHP